MVRAELGIRESSSHVITGLRGELDIEGATRIAVDLAPRQQALRVLTATGLNHVFSVHASVTSAAHAAAAAGSQLHPASDRADAPAHNGFPADSRIVKGQR